MYHGYTFSALFFAISVELWWGGIGAFLLRIEIFLYGKLVSSACYASNSIVQFNHEGFVICSNNLATYVYQAQIKKIELFRLLQGMFHGYPFFALFFAFLVDLWWGCNGALFLRIENILYGKLMSSTCYASNSIVQFNNKGFVICSNDLATCV